jgi:hypothetical protein
MSDDLDISGGAGGLTARFDDMRTFAGLVDTSADNVRGAGLRTAALIASADLAQAAVICPVEVGEVEVALGLASSGPTGAVTTSVEMEVLARLVRSSITAYEFTDAQLAALVEKGFDVAGFALGATAVPLLVGGVGALALTNPLLLAELGAAGYLDRDALAGELQATIYDNPWMEEALTRMAPGMVQGGMFSTLGPFWSVALSGGEWPTTDFPSAVSGLINLGNVFGAFQDSGTFHTEPVDGYEQPIDLTSDHFLSNIFSQQGNLGAAESAGQVQVIAIEHPGLVASYVVQIPGTQDWSPFRTDNPVDLTTNVALEAMAHDTKMQQAVREAMEDAGIPPDAPVMLTGHSQGGITAAALTADPDFRDRFNVKSVVTGGSPIGRIDIPDDVSVLSLEHDQDVVPKLEGKDNPDRANWITVRRELSDAEGALDTGSPGLGGAHSTSNYATTGHDIDVSTAATIERWRAENAEFFTPGADQPATATRYQISRSDP